MTVVRMRSANLFAYMWFGTVSRNSLASSSEPQIAQYGPFSGWNLQLMASNKSPSTKVAFVHKAWVEAVPLLLFVHHGSTYKCVFAVGLKEFRREPWCALYQKVIQLLSHFTPQNHVIPQNAACVCYIDEMAKS